MDVQKPLSGLSIVNTRAVHQAGELTAALEALGGSVLHYPAIRIAPPLDPAALDATLAAALDGGFDWMVVTSVNTAASLAERLDAIGLHRALAKSGLPVAAVGPATAEAVERLLGIVPALVPEEYVAESLAGALSGMLSLQAGRRLFLPQSEIARPFLADAFRRAGAEVVQLTAYRTLTGRGGDPVPALFWEGRIDAVTFTSPSTVHNFLKRLKQEGGSGGMLVDVTIACIGPQTARAAQAHDLRVQVVPDEHTVEGLVAGLARHVASIVRAKL